MTSGVYSRTLVPLKDRFWKYVDKSGDCWLWMGATNGRGYGQIRECKQPNRKERLFLATHVAWMLSYGEMPPPKMSVCHKCDIPSCVNPEHLFLGTQADNLKDMARKGRSNAGNKNPNAKLNETQVHAIRGSRKPASILALHYGVHKTAIERIQSRKTWRHL